MTDLPLPEPHHTGAIVLDAVRFDARYYSEQQMIGHREEYAAARTAALEAECARLRADEKRLDWLADPKNTVGNVTIQWDGDDCIVDGVRYVAEPPNK